MKNAQKIVVFIWLLLVSLGAMALLFLIWNDNIFQYFNIQNRLPFKTYSYVFLAGILGGTVYAWRGFYQSIAAPDGSDRAFDFKWIYWYIIRPLTSGIFGFVIYAFVRAELVAFGSSSQISEQNNLMYFVLAFLAGFGFHDFAEYLNLRIKKLFNKND